MTGHRPTLPDTPFPDDDGSADPGLEKLLGAARSGTPTDYLRAVAGLCSGRLLVPVVTTHSGNPAPDLRQSPSAGSPGGRARSGNPAGTGPASRPMGRTGGSTGDATGERAETALGNETAAPAIVDADDKDADDKDADDKDADNKDADDKDAEMAVAMLQTGDGRRGLAVFTSLQALTDWNHTARPVPVTLDRAAASARQASAEALLIDIDAPHSLVIEGGVLRQLAAGHRLVEVGSGRFGWAMPADDTD